MCLAEFQKFKVKAKNQSGQRLKILIINGEGEFNSTKFKKFYEEHGIEYEVTSPYTPQHNGLVKMGNKNLLDMTRSILKEKNLPKQLL